MPKNANQMWTDVDLAKLAKLIRKYPAGTLDRWEKIAEILERLPREVTKMAKKIKDNAYMVPVSQGAQGITGKIPIHLDLATVGSMGVREPQQ